MKTSRALVGLSLALLAGFLSVGLGGCRDATTGGATFTEDSFRNPVDYVTLGTVDQLRSQLDAGLDPNTTDEYGTPLLHHAVGAGRLDSVKLLVERGARVNSFDTEGQTPIDIAGLYGQADIAAYLAGVN